MKIITNNVPRNIIYGFELTESEKADFDYMNEDDDNAIDNYAFVRYRGELISLNDFIAWDNPLSPTRGKWDGIRTDSYFSGVVIRYVNDYDQVVCGLALS